MLLVDNVGCGKAVVLEVVDRSGASSGDCGLPMFVYLRALPDVLDLRDESHKSKSPGLRAVASSRLPKFDNTMPPVNSLIHPHLQSPP